MSGENDIPISSEFTTLLFQLRDGCCVDGCCVHGHNGASPVIDLEVDVGAKVDLSGDVAKQYPIARFAGLWFRLAALAREDERLRELLDAYAVRVRRGEEVLLETRGYREAREEKR